MKGWNTDAPSGFVLSAAGEIAPGAAAACTRLVCASRWLGEGSVVSELIASRRARMRLASESGLRTALLSASGWVLRWYEGTAEAVDAEWERLQARLPREDVRLLHRSEGAGMLRQPVQVASLHAPEAAPEGARRMAAIVRELRQGSIADPAELWQAFAAPCRLAYPDSLGFLARREVVVLASEGHEAVDIVRVLAHASAQPLAYQRYAGADLERRDMGAAYVDLPAAPGVLTRVHALPRRALADGMPLLGVRNVRCIVVLPGRGDARSEALLGAVRAVLPQLPVRPATVEIAPDSRDAAALVWDMAKAAVATGRWSARLPGSGRLAREQEEDRT